MTHDALRRRCIVGRDWCLDFRLQMSRHANANKKKKTPLIVEYWGTFFFFPLGGGRCVCVYVHKVSWVHDC